MFEFQSDKNITHVYVHPRISVKKSFIFKLMFVLVFVWFSFKAYHYTLFNAKPHLHTHTHIYINIYMIFKHILLIIFLNEPKLILFHRIKRFKV